MGNAEYLMLFFALRSLKSCTIVNIRGVQKSYDAFLFNFIRLLSIPHIMTFL